MTKKSKKILTASFAASAFAMLAVGGAIGYQNNTVYAANEPTVNEVYIRTPEGTEDNTMYGIRFQASVSASAYNEQAKYIMQIKYVDQDVADAKTTNALATTYDEEGDRYTFMGSLVNIQMENTTRPCHARAGYQIGEETPVFGEWSDPRVIFTVATQALADQSKDWGTAAEKLNNFVNTATDTSYAGHYTLKSSTATPETGTLADLTNGDKVTVSVELENSRGNTLTAYPKLSVKSPTGFTMDDDTYVPNKFTQVSGTQDSYEVDFTSPTAFKLDMKVGNVTDSKTCGMTETSYNATNVDGLVTMGASGYYVHNADTGAYSASNSGVTNYEYRSNYAFTSLGAYSVGETLEFRFTGKNIPNVVLFADTQNGQTVGGGKGLNIQTSGAVAHRLWVHGPNRTETGVRNDYTAYNDEFAKGADQIYLDIEDAGSSSLISVGKLDASTDYCYRITTNKISETVVQILIKLYTVGADDSLTLVKTLNYYTQAHKLSTIENTYAIAYGVHASQSTTFTYSKSNETVANGSYTLRRGGEDYHVTGGYTAWDYVATRGIKLNEKLEISFTGKNIPNVVFLADKANGQAYLGGKGYAFIAAQTQSTASKRFYASGPDRAALDGNGMFGRGTTGIITSGGDNKDKLSRSDLVDGTEYLLTILATKNVSGTVTITYSLDDKTTNVNVRTVELTSQATDTYDDTLFVNGDEAYPAIIYGSAIADTTLSYSIKEFDPLAGYTAINQENVDTLLAATSGKFKLTSDIDLTGKVTTASAAFSGILDGQGNSIKNLTTETNKGLFNSLAASAVVRNVTFENLNVSAAQSGAFGATISGGTIFNVIFKTATNINVGNLSGVMGKQLAGNLSLYNVIVVASSARNDDTDGFIAGFTDVRYKVNAVNTYFVVTSNLSASGVRTHSSPQEYYNQIAYSADSETSRIFGLQASETDTKYGNMFVSGSTYEIYANATHATAIDNFKSAIGSGVTLNKTVQTMWNNLFPTT